MRLSELIGRLERLQTQLILEAGKDQLFLANDPYDPEILVEQDWGKTRCGTVKVDGILGARTINNQIVLTLDR